MTKRTDYTEKMKNDLDALNAKMNELDAKAVEIKQDALHMYQEEMRKVRHESKMAFAKLDQIKEASSETWESMVTEMEKVRDAFVHSFSYFKSQLK